MKVKIIKRYYDKELKRLVEKESKLEVTEERGKQLIEAGVAIEMKEPKVKEVKKSTKKVK